MPLQIPSVVNALSGGLGGVVANFCVFPLDLVTTRLQVQNKVHTDTHYSSIGDAFRKIYKDGGITAFYEGLGGDSTATMLQAFLYFFAYDYLRNARVREISKRRGRVPRTLGVGEELLIGTAAGLFCKAITSPINNIVIRQQAANMVEGRELSARECAQEIYDAKGLSGFWTGYKPTVILSVNPSLTYYFYQTLFARLIPRRRQHRASTLEVFLIAAIAKSLASLITYPLILVKTRTQVDTDDKDLPFYQAIYNTVTKDGFGSLYEGCHSQVLKGFFSQGITMMTKDKITRLIVLVWLTTTRSRQ